MTNFRNKLVAFMNKKYFFETMLGVDLVFGFLGWLYFSSIAIFVTSILAVSLLFITREIKWSLPFIGQSFFLFNGSFLNKIDVILFAIGIAILFFGLIIYIILNRIKIKEARMKWSYLILGVLCLIPILYCKVPSGYELHYVYFFQWILYLIVYIMIFNLVQGDLTIELSKSYGTIASLLALQCIYMHFGLKQDWFFVGWGHANYANFMMILFASLIVYMIIKETSKLKIIYILELLLIIVGCYASGSRSFYVFFLLEAGLMYLYFVIKNKKWKLLIASITVGLLIVGIVFIIPQTRNKIMQLMAGDPEAGFFSGRLDIWKESLDKFKESPLSIIFGHGAFTWLSNKYNGTNGTGEMTLQLCHSTFFQSLVMMGIVGIIAMGYHFYLKYKLLIKDKSLLGKLLLIGFFVNDLCGLIDNTYHSYYFMISFIIIYGVYEQSLSYRNSTKPISEREENK